MKTLNYRSTNSTFINYQAPQPAKFYQLKTAPEVNKWVNEPVKLSDREIVIANEPETIVIIGYEEFGDLLGIYGKS